MVEVEIRTPIYNEEAERVDWVAVALVRADGDSLERYGEPSTVPLAPVVSITTGKSVEHDDNPEEWARNLPNAYRAGDLTAVIIHDDNPPIPDTDDSDFVEPSIPEPPAPVHEDAPADAAIA